MPASYDVSTIEGQLRLLISDIGGTSGSDFIFEDEEIEAFLGMEPSLYMAAATAFRTLAANEALVSKRIKFLELQTDGAAVAKSLLAIAESLEKRDVEGDGSELFDIVPIGDTDFSRRNLGRIW